MGNNSFATLSRLPPYAFSVIGDLKAKARARGVDIIDFGMGNPDQPTPEHIVAKLVESATKPKVHRYSVSKGLPRLRSAICNWYARRYAVKLNPDTEAIACIGSKEGLAHLTLACMGKGDLAIVPTPAYPVHPYGFVISGADIRQIAMTGDEAFFVELEQIITTSWPRPRMLVVNFPNNPTGKTVDLAFFKRLVKLCKSHNLWLINDIAYADIVFDGGEAPSVLQVPGAKSCAIEFFSLSKSYNMPGWRVGFACGNKELVHALGRIKSYLDYGTFTPIQVAAIEALEGDQSCVAHIRDLYRKRRDVLCEGLADIGWDVELPKATMFVWAKIPDRYLARGLRSMEFSKRLLTKAKVAVSPGLGFGVFGDDYVRFALIENDQRTRQALRNIKQMFRQDGVSVKPGVAANPATLSADKKPAGKTLAVKIPTGKTRVAKKIAVQSSIAPARTAKKSPAQVAAQTPAATPANTAGTAGTAVKPAKPAAANRAKADKSATNAAAASVKTPGTTKAGHTPSEAAG